MNDMRPAGAAAPRSLEERVLDVMSVQNWIRYRFVIECAIAGSYFVFASLVEVGRGGISAIFTALLLAVALLLHRIQPLAALGLSVFTLMVLPIIGYGGSSPTPILWFPVIFVIFGSSAYGRPATKWLGLGYVGVLALFVGGNWWFFGSMDSFAYSIIALGALGIPWLAGALARSAVERRALGKSVVQTEVRLNAVEQEVSLEQERNRVARDVHDIVAHSLAVVIAQADGARYVARTSPAAVDEALENIAATARGALSDVRVLLTELRHSQERGPQPGMDDLDGLVRGFRESGLDITWTSYGSGVPLSEGAGLAVYRVVQEALTNALRHGGRDRPVDLEFDWSDVTLTVSVTNDLPEGERIANPSGHGIPGMRERAALAGGSFSAGDGTNGRFRVRAVLPFDRGSARTQPVATHTLGA